MSTWRSTWTDSSLSSSLKKTKNYNLISLPLRRLPPSRSRSLPLHLLLGRCRRRRPQSLPYYQERRLLSLFAGFPPLAAALEPILTLIAAYRSIPYAAFVVFFALYLGVVNSQFSRYVRFNAMQVVVLDVVPRLALSHPARVQRSD
ncbi:hypothetical protein J5N97_010478 [Dioscorea zingiberensis]|uniref:Protein TIC 20 n=1 Tax=Dioscorea zingiberensis TaxID=325984 RepID=A0A9D5D193_9LILI|nr:hypothetical protein J5N97_010478 [Dioscorea zingiberensis]